MAQLLNVTISLGSFQISLPDEETTSHLKNADHVHGQGANRRKSAAYVGVCEHFEEARKTVIER